MKNKIILILLSICLLSSCSDSFLDRNSLVGLSEGDYWKSQEDAVQAINPLYHANRQIVNSIVIYGMMDDFTDISYQSWATGLTTGANSTNGKIYADTWGILYKGIYRANTALKYIPDISMDGKIKDRCLGEAKFFRGYFYFKLWDYFGGVPIYDYPMNIDEAYKIRNTEQEVYDFIVQDLTDAYLLLPEKYDPKTDLTNVGRATKWAALAMRGKAHLWAKQYDKAA